MPKATAVKNASRRSAAVALFELGGELGLRQVTHAAEPYLADRSISSANAPHILAVARGPGGEADATTIGAGYGNFGRIGERVWQRRDAHRDFPPHRHEIDSTPWRPPPAGPVMNLAGRCATPSEACQDIDSSVHPAIRRPIHRVGDHRNGELGVRQDHSTTCKALKRTAVTEPLPFGGSAADDAKPVIALDTGIRITPLPTRHFTAA